MKMYAVCYLNKDAPTDPLSTYGDGYRFKVPVQVPGQLRPTVYASAAVTTTAPRAYPDYKMAQAYFQGLLDMRGKGKSRHFGSITDHSSGSSVLRWSFNSETIWIEEMVQIPADAPAMDLASSLLHERPDDPIVGPLKEILNG